MRGEERGPQPGGGGDHPDAAGGARALGRGIGHGGRGLVDDDEGTPWMPSCSPLWSPVSRFSSTLALPTPPQLPKALAPLLLFRAPPVTAVRTPCPPRRRGYGSLANRGCRGVRYSLLRAGHPHERHQGGAVLWLRLSQLAGCPLEQRCRPRLPHRSVRP